MKFNLPRNIPVIALSFSELAFSMPTVPTQMTDEDSSVILSQSSETAVQDKEFNVFSKQRTRSRASQTRPSGRVFKVDESSHYYQIPFKSFTHRRDRPIKAKEPIGKLEERLYSSEEFVRYPEEGKARFVKLIKSEAEVSRRRYLLESFDKLFSPGSSFLNLSPELQAQGIDLLERFIRSGDRKESFQYDSGKPGVVSLCRVFNYPELGSLFPSVQARVLTLMETEAGVIPLRYSLLAFKGAKANSVLSEDDQQQLFDISINTYQPNKDALDSPAFWIHRIMAKECFINLSDEVRSAVINKILALGVVDEAEQEMKRISQALSRSDFQELTPEQQISGLDLYSKIDEKAHIFITQIVTANQLELLTPTQSSALEELLITHLNGRYYRSYSSLRNYQLDILQCDREGTSILDHLIAVNDPDNYHTAFKARAKSLSSEAFAAVFEINQGHQAGPICGMSSVRNTLACYQPAEYLRVARGLLSPEARVEVNNGTLFCPKDFLLPEYSEKAVLSELIDWTLTVEVADWNESYDVIKHQGYAFGFVKSESGHNFYDKQAAVSLLFGGGLKLLTTVEQLYTYHKECPNKPILVSLTTSSESSNHAILLRSVAGDDVIILDSNYTQERLISRKEFESQFDSAAVLSNEQTRYPLSIKLAILAIGFSTLSALGLVVQKIRNKKKNARWGA